MNLKDALNLFKQEVGDDVDICVLDLEFVELKSYFIRNVLL